MKIILAKNFDLKLFTVEIPNFSRYQFCLPASTKFLMIERNRLYITDDISEPTINSGFVDEHKNEWVDFPTFSVQNLNKVYVGRIVDCELNDLHCIKLQ